jgi:O-antigen/teichoic acid export membrane protein
MSIVKRSLKTFLWSFMGSLLGFIFQIIVARYLGPEEYGKANVLLGLNGTFLIFLNFGLTTLLTREIATSYEDPKLLLSKYTYIYVLLDLLTFPIIFFFLKKLLEKVNMYNIINVILVLFLTYLNQFSNLLTSYLIGIKKQDINAFLKNFFIKILNLIFFFFLYYFFLDNYLLILIVQLMSLLLIFIIFSSQLRFKKIKLNSLLSFFKEVFKESWQFYLISILYSLYNNISKYLQKLYTSERITGFLSLGMSLSVIGLMLGQILATIMMPEFAENWKKKDLRKIEYLFKKVSRYNAYIILPIILFTITNIGRILDFLRYDSKEGALIVSLMIISSFFNSFVGPNGTLLIMSQKQKYEIFNGIILISTGFGLGLFLGVKFEWGIAFSIALSIFIVNIIKTIEVGILFKIYPYSLKNFLYIICFSFIIFLVFDIAKSVKNLFLFFALNSVIIVFSIVFFFYFSTEKDDRLLLKNVMKKFINFM